MLQAYQNQNNQLSDNIVDKARQELAEIEKERERSKMNKNKGQSDSAREFEDLMKLVRSAEKKGNIRLTRRNSMRSKDPKSDEQDVHDLIALVKAANSIGNIRILRRRSTDKVKMTKTATLSFTD